MKILHHSIYLSIFDCCCCRDFFTISLTIWIRSLDSCVSFVVAIHSFLIVAWIINNSDRFWWWFNGWCLRCHSACFFIQQNGFVTKMTLKPHSASSILFKIKSSEMGFGFDSYHIWIFRWKKCRCLAFAHHMVNGTEKKEKIGSTNTTRSTCQSVSKAIHYLHLFFFCFVAKNRFFFFSFAFVESIISEIVFQKPVFRTAIPGWQSLFHFYLAHIRYWTHKKAHRNPNEMKQFGQNGNSNRIAYILVFSIELKRGEKNVTFFAQRLDFKGFNYYFLRFMWKMQIAMGERESKSKNRHHLSRFMH